jgi:peptidyl-prolyl cis-trans isomerase D
MFTHIRRHQKWLWIFISAAVIISFVWYFNPNQQMGAPGSGTAGGPVGSIYGTPISRREYGEAYREAILHYLFQYKEWPQDNEVTRQLRPVERETRQRLFLIRKMKDYNIKVTDSAVADLIVQYFQDPETKRFHKENLERFYQNLQQKGLARADFERYMRNQVGITHLAAIAGIPGKLVTPQEAEYAYRQEHEKVDTKLVTLSTSNFVAQIQITPEAITNFYNNNAALYRLPERLQLSYVAFPASNFTILAEEKLNGITNLAQQIDAIYQQRGANFYTDASQQPLPADAAKAKIREELRHDFEMNEARRVAYEFATELEKIPASTNSANPAVTLENLAAAKGLQAQVTEPFTQFSGPAGLGLPDDFVRAAFRLTPDEPIIPEPVSGENGVYVLAFKNRIESQNQPFELVQNAVTEEYKRREAQRLTREAGARFATNISSGLASGKDFDTLVREAGYNPVDVPPFARGDRAVPGLPLQVDVGPLSNTAFNQAPGQASNFQPSRDGGYIVLTERFVPVPDEEAQRELPQFVQELRRRSAGEAFNQWFVKEMQLAQLNLPGDGLDRSDME